MSTKKLTALLETASVEEVAVINEVIASRTQSVASGDADHATRNEDGTHSYSAPEEPLTAEEQAILDAAETGKTTGKPKMSNEECEALAETLKVNVGSRCKVVPFNTIEWAEGTIVGVIADKRSVKVLYAIKLDDGRRIVKAHNSKMIQISEEKVEIKRTSTRTKAEATDKLSEEALMEAVEAAKAQIGLKCEFSPFKPIEGHEKLNGVIVAIVPDKRSGRILYRIEASYEVGDKIEKITAHKVQGVSDLVISEELDTEVREKYEKRVLTTATRMNVSPEERVSLSKKALEKAVADLERIQKLIEVRTADLQKAEADYAAWLETAENAPETTTEEATGATAEGDDLN